MINFRYHIVSLMAVFMALSVGIAVGVSLRPSVDQGIITQANQDRQTVAALRAELDRRKALADYRDAYDQRTGGVVAKDVLVGVRVAIVAMPDAPNAVVESISAAAVQAGGQVVREVTINPSVFDPGAASSITKALTPWAGELQIQPTTTPSVQIGLALGRSIAGPGGGLRDPQALAIGKALTSNGWATISNDPEPQAQLVLVVTAPALDPRPAPELLAAHVELDLGLRNRAPVVLAGPNSGDVEGTDVLTARSDAAALDRLSTVDVADLSSGVTTTILAGREQLNGAVGRHYGALTKADAPLPELPVR